MANVNKTRFAILGILNNMPGSGYDIKKNCDTGIAYFWNENFGHIYPVLKQMEKDGAITKKEEKGEGRPSRNVYYITEKGKEELINWLMSPVEPSPQRLELQLKLTFAKLIPAEKTIEELERVKERHKKDVEEFRRVEQEFFNNEDAQNYESYPYWYSNLRYGIGDAEFRIRWCEETIERIKFYKVIKKDK